MPDLDQDLLDRFLGSVLDAYKDGTITQSVAIGDIAHMVVALNLTTGDDPNKYMKAKLAKPAGDDE
jgi:hypothetical protein